jgi:Tfp pilus assembly protein PilF
LSSKSSILVLILVLFVSGCVTSTGVNKPAAPAEKKVDEKSSEAYKKFTSGLMAMNHGNWEKAKKYFLEALELDPKGYNTHIYLAKAYANTNDKLKAVEEYRKAIDLKKDAYSAYYDLTGVYIDMSLPAEAAKVCEEALANGVPESVVSTDLGWCYYLAGDLKKAEARLRTAKKLAEKDTVSRNDLGLVLFSLGNYDEALDNFQEALKLNPKSTLAPYYAALTYNKLGKEDKVLDALRDGIKKDPDLPKKAAFYNSKYFPHGDPGDLGPYFEKLKKEKDAK